MNEEQYGIIRQVFPNVSVVKEGDRILINHFLAIEPKEIEIRSIGKTRKCNGFFATLDNGEDCVELYEGPIFWDAMEALVVELAKYNLSVLRDKIHPCMIPTGRY